MSYTIKRGDKNVCALPTLKEAVAAARDILRRAEEEEFTLTIHTEVARVQKKLIHRTEVSVDMVQEFKPKGESEA